MPDFPDTDSWEFDQEQREHPYEEDPMATHSVPVKIVQRTTIVVPTDETVNTEEALAVIGRATTKFGQKLGARLVHLDNNIEKHVITAVIEAEAAIPDWPGFEVDETRVLQVASSSADRC